jgi:hypothetical protein
VIGRLWWSGLYRSRRDEENGFHSAEWAGDCLSGSALGELDVTVAKIAWADDVAVIDITRDRFGHTGDGLFEFRTYPLARELENFR